MPGLHVSPLSSPPDSDDTDIDYSDIDSDKSDEQSDSDKFPLEIGFDKIMCRICGMPCMRCPVCQRFLYKIAPYSCTKTVDHHLRNFCWINWEDTGGFVRADVWCCYAHNRCWHEFIAASRNLIWGNNGDWP